MPTAKKQQQQNQSEETHNNKKQKSDGDKSEVPAGLKQLEQAQSLFGTVSSISAPTVVPKSKKEGGLSMSAICISTPVASKAKSINRYDAKFMVVGQPKGAAVLHPAKNIIAVADVEKKISEDGLKAAYIEDWSSPVFKELGCFIKANWLNDDSIKLGDHVLIQATPRQGPNQTSDGRQIYMSYESPLVKNSNPHGPSALVIETMETALPFDHIGEYTTLSAGTALGKFAAPEFFANSDSDNVMTSCTALAAHYGEMDSLVTQKFARLTSLPPDMYIPSKNPAREMAFVVGIAQSQVATTNTHRLPPTASRLIQGKTKKWWGAEWAVTAGSTRICTIGKGDQHTSPLQLQVTLVPFICIKEEGRQLMPRLTNEGLAPAAHLSFNFLNLTSMFGVLDLDHAKSTMHLLVERGILMTRLPTSAGRDSPSDDINDSFPDCEHSYWDVTSTVVNAGLKTTCGFMQEVMKNCKAKDGQPARAGFWKNDEGDVYVRPQKTANIQIGIDNPQHIPEQRMEPVDNMAKSGLFNVQYYEGALDSTKLKSPFTSPGDKINHEGIFVFDGVDAIKAELGPQSDEPSAVERALMSWASKKTGAEAPTHSDVRTALGEDFLAYLIDTKAATRANAAFKRMLE